MLAEYKGQASAQARALERINMDGSFILSSCDGGKTALAGMRQADVSSYSARHKDATKTAFVKTKSFVVPFIMRA
jgi:hypothetical protein